MSASARRGTIRGLLAERGELGIAELAAEFEVSEMTIRRDLEEAVHTALSGRPGPVWIDIPLDVPGAIWLVERCTDRAGNVAHVFCAVRYVLPVQAIGAGGSIDTAGGAGMSTGGGVAKWTTRNLEG